MSTIRTVAKRMDDTQPEEPDGDGRDNRVFSISFRTTPEVRDALNEAAQAQRRSVSQVVHLICLDSLKPQADRTP